MNIKDLTQSQRDKLNYIKAAHALSDLRTLQATEKEIAFAAAEAKILWNKLTPMDMAWCQGYFFHLNFGDACKRLPDV